MQVTQSQIVQDRDRLVALSHASTTTRRSAGRRSACGCLAEILAGAGFAVETTCRPRSSTAIGAGMIAMVTTATAETPGSSQDATCPRIG